MALFCSKKDCQFGSSPNDVFIYCRLCNTVIHPKCTGLVGRVKDFIDLRFGFSWTCASCVEIDLDLDGYVMKLFDKLMSVVADFKEFKADLNNKKMSVGSPKRKKTAPSKSAPVKPSVPNPNLAPTIFTRSVTAAMSASTGSGGPKASLAAVPIGTKSSGGVPVPASQPKG